MKKNFLKLSIVCLLLSILLLVPVSAQAAKVKCPSCKKSTCRLDGHHFEKKNKTYHKHYYYGFCTKCENYIHYFPKSTKLPSGYSKEKASKGMYRIYRSESHKFKGKKSCQLCGYTKK